MKTAGLFADITNQYYSTLQNPAGLRIDYEKYLAEIGRNYNLYRAFAFGAQINNEASSFINVLRNIGFEARYRKAIMVGDRPDIRRTDRNIALAMEVWRTIEKLDVVIIGSNDPDLVPLVHRVKELGIHVNINSCNICCELKDAADSYTEIAPTMMYKKTSRED